jgi:hypothetical protein
MPIYRGVGGSGDATTDAYASQVALDAQTATTKANEASASATAAAASESAVSTDATAAEAAKVAAQAAQTAAELAENNAETAENNAASSATAAAASAAAAAATAASIGDLDSLSDVTVTTPSTGQVLKYNGSAWVNDTDAGGLANIVEDTTPQLGGTLDANGNTIDMGTNTITDTKVGQWDTAYGWGDHSTEGYLTGITGQSIKSLSDVYSSMSPTDGQVLTYDTTNGWQAETSASPSPDAIPKAWAAVNMSTGLLDSYNVASGVFSSGDFYLYWDDDMSDTNYAIVTGHQQNSGTTIQFGVLTGSIAVGSARFFAYSGGSGTNLGRCYVAVYDT